MSINRIIKRLSFIILSCSLLLITGCQSSSQKENKSNDHVTVSIHVKPIFDHEEELKDNKKEYVPDDGMVLTSEMVNFEEGDTIMNVLKKAAKQQNVVIDFEAGAQSSTGSSFIKGINQIYNGDCGAMSGWMYKVNGEWAEVPADQMKAEKQQNIEWVFICDYEIDIKKY